MTNPSLIDLAIEAALSQDWQRAIEINSQIVKSEKENIGALNRLGYAYINIGRYTEAKKIFSKVKSLDPYNQIAIRNLAKIEIMKNQTNQNSAQPSVISPLEFLEDPGKTKLVQCVNVAPAQIISRINSGVRVNLKVRNHAVEIRNGENQYLGALPDDISFRLIKLIAANYRYEVIIKNVDKNCLTVLIREKERGKKFASQPSFINPVIYHDYQRESAKDLDKPDITPTGEEEPGETG